jgi:acyl-CoA synthetase (AMP-forming)/AMP-acid ligase II
MMATGDGSAGAALLIETVGDVLARQARANGGRRALLWEEGEGQLGWLTYAELEARANAVAHELEPPDLEAFLAERVAHFKIPQVWRFVEAFPMTASGKIRRVAVKEEMNALPDHGGTHRP